MIYLELFLAFLRIGFSSFGGMTMISVIMDEVVKNNWMSASQVMDVVAIAEMTPGALGLNCATFAGIQIAGIPGAFAANLGVLAPSLTVCLAAAVFIEKLRGNTLLEAALKGVRPVSLGMLLSVVVTMSSVFYTETGILINRLVLAAILAFILFKFKISIPKLVGISMVLGLVFGY